VAKVVWQRHHRTPPPRRRGMETPSKTMLLVFPGVFSPSRTSIRSAVFAHQSHISGSLITIVRISCIRCGLTITNGDMRYINSRFTYLLTVAFPRRVFLHISRNLHLAGGGACGAWKVLKFQILRFPGLESLGKRYRSWKTLEKSWYSKVLVLETLLSGSSITH